MKEQKIDGNFRLGSSSEGVQWEAHAPPPCPRDDRSLPVLWLQNATVGALVDTESSWENMEWEGEGFTYSFLSQLNAPNESGTSPYNRDDKWFIEWLEKDGSYSPQPYRQLANVFRAAGYDEKADGILFASRDRERSESGPIKWLLLTTLKFFIGYGYGLYLFSHALAWFLALVALGTAVVFIEERKRDKKDGSLYLFLNCLLYSLDVLLPGIELRKHHRVGDALSERAHYWFYSLKLAGYVLIFFVIAGLAGLTE